MDNQFVHLHVHSEYSLLDGACRLDPLIDRCKELGMTSLAITDHGVMYGAVDFYTKCLDKGVKPIIGCEVYCAQKSRFDRNSRTDADSYHLILLAKNNVGYKNLIQLVSLASVEGYYYKPRIDKEILQKYSEGLICCSACLGGELPQLIMQGAYKEAKEQALWFDGVFGSGNYYLELQSNGIEAQLDVNKALIDISKETGIPLVATNDVHFIRREDSATQDILLCIQTGKKYGDEDRMRFETDQFYLKSPEEMYKIFGSVPEALENTVKIAEMCDVKMNFGRSILPNFEIPEGFTSETYLRHLCYEGAKFRFGDVIPQEAIDRIEYELSVICKMGYADYYLIVWDFINYAKTHGITVGPGRGSGAASLVAYCLKITNIPSLKYNLAFERFLNPERISMPDFDVDFADTRRKEVIDYVTRKYGADCVAQIITFGTMAARNAIRDVGRVLDMPYADVDVVAKLIPNELKMTIDKALVQSKDLKALYDSDEKYKKLIDTAKQLEGMPRNFGTHAAGVVLTKDPVTSYVPVQKSDTGVLTQYPMANLEKLGLLKVDFLGLRTLTVIQEALELIKKNHNVTVDFDNMEMDDPKVFKKISDGDTVAIFQLESAGMKRFMTELKPGNLEDIIAGIALYRPGPMDQIPKYIENKKHPENIVYDDPRLEHILDVTYGCMVYQEQVMQIVRDLAGYTMGHSDLVRRAMAKKKYDVMLKERAGFVEGAAKNGVSEEVSNKIFDQMMDFASYAFNKAHAACYAVVAYETAWLKVYYPVELMCATMNSLLSNAQEVAAYVSATLDMGIEVLPPSVNESYTGFTVENGKIRFGLGALKNVGENAILSMVEERENNGPFKSFFDFCKRMKNMDLNKRALDSIIKAGAFDQFPQNRNQLLRVYDEILDSVQSADKHKCEGQISFFDLMEDDRDAAYEDFDHYPDLKEMPKSVLLAFEREVAGIYISGNPLDEYTDFINKNTNATSLNFKAVQGDDNDNENHGTQIADGQNVVYCGIITEIKKKITKNNATMAFVKILDRFGEVETLVFPKTYDSFRDVITDENIVVVTGRASVRENEAATIISERIDTPETYRGRPERNNYTKPKRPQITITVSEGRINELNGFAGFFEGTLPVVVKLEGTDQSKIIKIMDSDAVVNALLKKFNGNTEN